MSTKRQLNTQGQMRIDVPHLRSIESSIAADIDLLAGKIMAGDAALVVRGFKVVAGGSGAIVGAQATSLNLDAAGGVLMHPLAGEAGTIFSVDPTNPLDLLSVSNDNVQGSFVPNAMNFVGVDLIRTADANTSDIVMFLDANTKQETPKTVPLARVLHYKIVISTVDFSSTPNVCPIAKILTNPDNTVASIQDARQLYNRLGSGGGSPDIKSSFPWVNGRKEGLSIFGGGDKELLSDKDWRDAVMTRLWELGAGEFWYSPTSDRELKLTLSESVLANGNNASWTIGTQTLAWKGLGVVFGNSTGFFNDIVDGTAVLTDGQCLYVDVDRTQNRSASLNSSLVPVVGTLTSLGSPVIPGSRVVIAWRKGVDAFLKDFPFDLNRNLGLPPSAGDPLNVLFEGAGGVHLWQRITTDMILSTLKINTFAANTSFLEKGVTATTPGFTATYLNGTPTTALLDDSVPNAQKNVTSSSSAFASDATFSGATFGSTLGSNPIVTFTLTADAGDAPSVKTTLLTWTRFFYSGVNASGAPTFNEAFVKGLPSTTGGSNVLAPTRAVRVQFLGANAPANKFVYFAYPAYYGDVVKIVDNLTGFTVTSAFAKISSPPTISVSVENAPGTLSENYIVYRTVQPQNGNVDFTVS
ncbi:hypothetical protein UFOVP75_141 [uncultured Caudovirales phage]|uniref:Uncharacterized protein n=1 Tax=uncultured Caudovirales phage TaxID=2100421 RepID=A0A6J5L240_9CAUD|nr:hypothetical protein UFOVP75_141 [uncultured Caudovirales phage]